MKPTTRQGAACGIRWQAGLWAGLGLALLTGCITEPTKDVLTSPFRAATDLTDGTTNATKELTQPTTDLTSSTSPKSWFTQDGMLRAEYRVRALAVFEYENLKEDIARGSGEYLSSAAVLAGIPAPGRQAFFRYAQSRFDYVYAEGIRPSESVGRVVQVLSHPPSS